MRLASSGTVSTPLASSRSEYSSPTPVMRIRSARLTHSSSRFSVTPDAFESSLRPAAVAPRVRSVAVEPTFAFASFAAPVAPIPSIV